MEVKIEESWKRRLSNEFEEPYFHELTNFVRQEYPTKQIFPPGKLIFHAFEQSPFEKTKVVILGQDPYHGQGQAHGLCFSVPDGIEQPPSLQNIFKEIEKDLGIPSPHSGNLDRWATQGVLLLNATLRGWPELLALHSAAIHPVPPTGQGCHSMGQEDRDPD